MPAAPPQATGAEEAPWHRRGLARFVIGLVEAAAVVACTASILGCVGRWHWFLDLISHFRGQYFAGLALCGVVLLIFRRWWITVICLLGLLANGVALRPLFAPKEPRAAASAYGIPWRVVTCNLFFENQNHAPTLRWLRESNADIIYLCEVTPAWSEAIRRELSDLYPYQHHHPQGDPFGSALLSRNPWLRVEEKQFGPFDSPSLAAFFDENPRGGKVVLGMHPTPPNGRRGSEARDAAFAEATRWLNRQSPRAKIVLGDLNATAWSAGLFTMMQQTGLEDTGVGFGWQPTWMYDSLLFQIPIDHILISKQWKVADRRIGPDLGSDHRAVIADLRYVGDRELWP